MSNWNLDNEDFERQYALGVAAEKAAADVEPRALEACFDAKNGVLAIAYRKGMRVEVPIQIIPELAGLTDAQLAKIALGAGGESLEWAEVDVHISVPGLTWRLFGSPDLARQAVAENARRAAATRSEARAAASRKNGAKGGRPKKVRSA
ncbi:MAG TPA: DUF2442 domain-containing protein [Oscillatoriaceae cyanobacterium]